MPWLESSSVKNDSDSCFYEHLNLVLDRYWSGGRLAEYRGVATFKERRLRARQITKRQCQFLPKLRNVRFTSELLDMQARGSVGHPIWVDIRKWHGVSLIPEQCFTVVLNKPSCYISVQLRPSSSMQNAMLLFDCFMFRTSCLDAYMKAASRWPTAIIELTWKSHIHKNGEPGSISSVSARLWNYCNLAETHKLNRETIFYCCKRRST